MRLSFDSRLAIPAESFFGANLLKLREGGWIPLLLAAVIFLVMTTWRRGIEAIGRSMAKQPETTGAFVAQLRSGKVARVPGTAFFFSRSDTAVPPVLARHVVQVKALQETVISLAVRFEEYPRVSEDNRAEVEKVAEGFWHVIIRFGFVEKPNVAAALAAAREKAARSTWMTRFMTIALQAATGSPNGTQALPLKRCSRRRLMPR